MNRFGSIDIKELGNEGNDLQICVNGEFKGHIELNEYPLSLELASIKNERREDKQYKLTPKEELLNNIWTSKILPLLKDANIRDVQNLYESFLLLSFISIRLNQKP